MKNGDEMKKWLKDNVFVKDMFLYIVIATIIFYIPTWVTALYALISGQELLYGVAGAWVLVWAGPFTPTIPIIFAIAIFIKQVVKKVKGKKATE